MADFIWASKFSKPTVERLESGNNETFRNIERAAAVLGVSSESLLDLGGCRSWSPEINEIADTLEALATRDPALPALVLDVLRTIAKHRTK